MLTPFKTAFVAASPRLSPRAAPLFSNLIYVAIAALWLGLFARAFGAANAFAWSAGIVYILYDTCLLGIVTRLTWPNRGAPDDASARAPLAPTTVPTLGVVIAAYNEAAMLPETLLALCAQTHRPDEILIVDDGSNDDTASRLHAQFGLTSPTRGVVSAPSVTLPFVRLLQLSRSGKAGALNAGIVEMHTDIIVTIDADTALAPDALGEIKQAFAADASVVAAGGLLVPVCEPTALGRTLQFFQTYEYIRNMVARFAWVRAESLVLISGAFAAFRRDALMKVGGFDTDCWVEDYELTHRLHRYSIEHGLGWRLRMVGTAHAITHAPGGIGAFLRQRRRWFAGFLQTQFWNRDMTGNRRFGRLGTLMMPIKALDTLQPIYGLTGFVLLVGFALTGTANVVAAAFGFMGGKILIDFGFNVWVVRRYRAYAGDRSTSHIGYALLAALLEPFSFQLLRHTGAAWGWIAFLTGRQGWGAQRRTALGANTRDWSRTDTLVP